MKTVLVKTDDPYRMPQRVTQINPAEKQDRQGLGGGGERRRHKE